MRSLPADCSSTPSRRGADRAQRLLAPFDCREQRLVVVALALGAGLCGGLDKVGAVLRVFNREFDLRVHCGVVAGGRDVDDILAGRLVEVRRPSPSREVGVDVLNDRARREMIGPVAIADVEALITTLLGEYRFGGSLALNDENALTLILVEPAIDITTHMCFSIRRWRDLPTCSRRVGRRTRTRRW